MSKSASTEAEVRQHAWAIRPELLRPLSAIVAGRAMEGTSPDPKAAAEEFDEVPTTGGVAVLSLSGLLTWKESLLSLLFGGSGGGLRGFRESFRAAIASEDVGSILINVDSPGGTVAQMTEIANEIRAARGQKPIIALANAQACSGAYWIGSQADEFNVTPSGVVGSIGVYVIHEDWSGWNEQNGVQPTYISAGKYKVEGNMDSPLDDEARDAIQAEVDDFYDLFVADVAAGRGVPEQTVREGFGEGRVLTAKRAVKEGLADNVETFESIVRRLTAAPASAERSSARFIGASAPQKTRTQSEDKSEPKAPVAEEAKTRIARVLAAQPITATASRS